MIDKLVNLYDDFAKGDRIRELERLADDEMFGFNKRSPIADQKIEIRGFRVFAKKGSKRFIGIMEFGGRAMNGFIRFYDYLRTVDLETKSTSVIEVYCEDIFTEYVKIEPKNAFDKMKGFFTSGSNRFPELTDFHQQFQILSRVQNGDAWLNEKALSTMIDFPNLTMEAEGNYFVFYQKNKTMEVHKILPSLAYAEEFVQLTTYDQSNDFV